MFTVFQNITLDDTLMTLGFITFILMYTHTYLHNYSFNGINIIHIHTKIIHTCINTFYTNTDTFKNYICIRLLLIWLTTTTTASEHKKNTNFVYNALTEPENFESLQTHTHTYNKDTHI